MSKESFNVVAEKVGKKINDPLVFVVIIIV